ncbi:MAG: aryldialkylphosphatase [Arthrobacter sp.]|nr:aryldialkylphosphatase [Arthrobacter sp.]
MSSPAAPAPHAVVPSSPAAAPAPAVTTAPAGAVPNLAGRVLTVAGPVEPAALGQVSMHEHVFLDIVRPAHNPRPGYDAPAAREPLGLQNLAAVRAGAALYANDRLGDPALMAREVGAFRDAGGGALVELSNLGLGRDAEALLGLYRTTGLHVVMGAGWYEREFHPADMDQRSVEELTGIIVRDIVEGVDGTGIRAGIIGEVGVDGNPLTANELKSVRASGRAARITGAPISFHRGGAGEEQHRVLDVLEEEGADLSRVVMGHAGTVGHDLAFARRLLARGVSVEFDFLGTTGSPWGTLFPFTDRTVARGILNLVEDGHAGRIVLGHDVCQAIQLAAFGGHGYGYLHRHFLPELVRMGLDPALLRTFLVENPARLLTFGAPRP